MGIGYAELLILLTIPMLLVGIGLFVWWILMLIEALRIPSSRWDAAGQSQILYVVMMLLLGVIGTILYVLIPRKVLPRPGV